MAAAWKRPGRQALLQGAEHPFHPPAPLGRIGRDMADAELRSARPTWVSGVLSTLPPAFGVTK